MATYTKKRRVGSGEGADQNEATAKDLEDSGSSLDDEEEAHDDDSPHAEINEEIQVEFEALPPQDNDFHGIKRLLHQLFLKSKVNLSELTNLILSQNHVGSVLKQSEAQLAEESDSSDDDDEDHVYGITTVINISDRKDESCIKDVHCLLSDKCSSCASSGDQNQFLRTLNDPNHSVGLMLNERFVNIPPQLAPPLHKSLQKDLQLASRKNPKFAFDYYLLICKSYREEGSSQPKKGKKKHKAVESQASASELMFSNAEDEYFHKAASVSFNYSVTAESDSALGGTWSFDDVEYKTFRTVMIVPSSRISDVLSQIEDNLTG